jgi:epoxide hydrolase
LIGRCGRSASRRRFRRLAERDNTIIHWPEDNPAGHHFIAMDQPGHLAADIRAFFARVR